MQGVNKNIPVVFEKIDQIDTRFQKVKIWLMHTGLNFNRSIFTREAVIKAMDSLKNTPILGYVEDVGFNEKDFRGHESETIVKGGELKERYIGKAYGVISESCNPRFEKKFGDYGEELEYLVVDGLIWTKFDEATEILDESIEVGQSMELHKEFNGYFDENENFVFTEFQFYGACMLGKDVPPAMQKASVERVFSTDEIQVEIAKKLEEYSRIVNYQKEVLNVNPEEKDEVQKIDEVALENETVVVEDVQEVQIEPVVVEEEVVVTEVVETETPVVDATEFEVKISTLEEEVGKLNLQLETLTTKNTVLEKFQLEVFAERHEVEVEALFSKFSKLEEEDIKDIKENVHNYTVEQVESTLFERLGRKMVNFNASKTDEGKGAKIKINQQEPSDIGGYDHVFKKHGIK